MDWLLLQNILLQILGIIALILGLRFILTANHLRTQIFLGSWFVFLSFIIYAIVHLRGTDLNVFAHLLSLFIFAASIFQIIFYEKFFSPLGFRVLFFYSAAWGATALILFLQSLYFWSIESMALTLCLLISLMTAFHLAIVFFRNDKNPGTIVRSVRNILISFFAALFIYVVGGSLISFLQFAESSILIFVAITSYQTISFIVWPQVKQQSNLKAHR